MTLAVTIILTALVTAIVSALVNGMAWMIFRRTIGNLDEMTRRQAVEIATLRDERVRVIEMQIAEHNEGRRRLYNKLEQEYLRRADHDRQDDKADRRVDAIFGEISDVKATIGNVDRRLAGVETTNAIIAKHLSLNVPASPAKTRDGTGDGP